MKKSTENTPPADSPYVEGKMILGQARGLRKDQKDRGGVMKHLAVVADGVGNKANSGNVADALVQATLEHGEDLPTTDDALLAWLKKIETRAKQLTASFLGNEKLPSSTFACAYVLKDGDKRKGQLISCGDSYASVFDARSGRLIASTVPHSIKVLQFNRLGLPLSYWLKRNLPSEALEAIKEEMLTKDKAHLMDEVLSYFISQAALERFGNGIYARFNPNGFSEVGVRPRWGSLEEAPFHVTPFEYTAPVLVLCCSDGYKNLVSWDSIQDAAAFAGATGSLEELWDVAREVFDEEYLNYPFSPTVEGEFSPVFENTVLAGFKTS